MDHLFGHDTFLMDFIDLFINFIYVYMYVSLCIYMYHMSAGDHRGHWALDTSGTRTKGDCLKWVWEPNPALLEELS